MKTNTKKTELTEAEALKLYDEYEALGVEIIVCDGLTLTYNFLIIDERSAANWHYVLLLELDNETGAYVMIETDDVEHPAIKEFAYWYFVQEHKL